MKKLIIFIVLSLSLIAYSLDSYPADIQRIIDRKKLIVAMYYQDFEPFFMHDKNGKFYGLDVSLAEDIAKELGVSLEFNRNGKTFNEVIDIVSRNEADMAISVLSATLNRAKKVLFTKPYIILHQGMVINRLKFAELKLKEDPFHALLSIKADIGVNKGSSYVNFCHELFPKAAVYEYDNWNKVIDALINKDIIAGLSDEIEILKSMKKNTDLALYLKIYIFEDKKDPISIAVPAHSYNLHQWLNVYLENKNVFLTPEQLVKKYNEIF
jgi:polar amino acid transport system substrate-binding protein